MESAKSDLGLSRTRAILERSRDFAALRGRGHFPVCGATLTCASDLPWQMQIRCARCHEIFWFDNLAWRTGGADRWRLNRESRAAAESGCAGMTSDLPLAQSRIAAFAQAARGRR